MYRNGEKEDGGQFIERGEKNAHHGPAGPDSVNVDNQLANMVGTQGEKVGIPANCDKSGNNNGQNKERQGPHEQTEAPVGAREDGPANEPAHKKGHKQNKGRRSMGDAFVDSEEIREVVDQGKKKNKEKKAPLEGIDSQEKNDEKDGEESRLKPLHQRHIFYIKETEADR